MPFILIELDGTKAVYEVATDEVDLSMKRIDDVLSAKGCYYFKSHGSRIEYGYKKLENYTGNVETYSDLELWLDKEELYFIVFFPECLPMDVFIRRGLI